MYRLTIIPSDGAVYIDVDVYLNLDLSFIDPTVHALQWRDGAGWIEYENSNNVQITELPDWAIEAMNLAVEPEQKLP